MKEMRLIILFKGPKLVAQWDSNTGQPGFWILVLKCSALSVDISGFYHLLTLSLVAMGTPGLLHPPRMLCQLQQHFLLGHGHPLGFSLSKGKPLWLDTAMQIALPSWYWFWGFWGFYPLMLHVAKHFPELVTVYVSIYVCIYTHIYTCALICVFKLF